MDAVKTVEKLLLVGEVELDTELLQSAMHMIGRVVEARQVSVNVGVTVAVSVSVSHPKCE